MKDRHYYLVRKAGSDKIILVYNFASSSWEDETTDHDVRTMVFYEQKKWGLWGWDCGTSVIEFQQHEKFEEILAEVSKYSHPYYCMYEGGKYPYFTFMNKETLEQVCLWSDLLHHDFHSNSMIAPDGTWGKYYDIPLSVFEKACELHKTLSNKFVRQYSDFVYAKTGITIPIKEYTDEEIEEEKAKLKKHEEEMRVLLYGSSSLHS